MRNTLPSLSDALKRILARNWHYLAMPLAQAGAGEAGAASAETATLPLRAGVSN